MSDDDDRQVYTCDGCGSWTDRPVRYEDLVSVDDGGWGWTEDEDGSVYCTECS